MKERYIIMHRFGLTLCVKKRFERLARVSNERSIGFLNIANCLTIL